MEVALASRCSENGLCCHVHVHAAETNACPGWAIPPPVRMHLDGLPQAPSLIQSAMGPDGAYILAQRAERRLSGGALREQASAERELYVLSSRDRSPEEGTASASVSPLRLGVPARYLSHWLLSVSGDAYFQTTAPHSRRPHDISYHSLAV